MRIHTIIFSFLLLLGCGEKPATPKPVIAVATKSSRADFREVANAASYAVYEKGRNITLTSEEFFELITELQSFSENESIQTFNISPEVQTAPIALIRFYSKKEGADSVAVLEIYGEEIFCLSGVFSKDSRGPEAERLKGLFKRIEARARSTAKH